MSRNQVINRENPANNQNDSVPFHSVLFCFVFSNPKKIELRVQLMTKGKKRKKQFQNDMFSLNMWVKSLGWPWRWWELKRNRLLRKGAAQFAFVSSASASAFACVSGRGAFVLFYSFGILQTVPSRDWQCCLAPTASHPPLRSLGTEPRSRGRKEEAKGASKSLLLIVTLLSSRCRTRLWDTGLMIWFPTTHTRSLAS